MREITCENHDGFSMTFGETAFSPFLLAHVEGIYQTYNNVTISENSMTDGGVYQGSISKVRNIVLTVSDKPNNRYALPQRDLLRQLFKEGQQGTLTYTEDGVSRCIDYYVESITTGSSKKRLFIVSLLCPNPHFYDKNPNSYSMASFLGDFEFEHEFVFDGEELGHRESEKLRNIVNESGADNIGITVTLKASGYVKNVSIVRVESNETLEIGTSVRPLEMQYGDILTVTTGIGNKHIWLERNGVKSEVNYYLSENSEFIQLHRGDNSIGYSAEEGENNLSVNVEYRLEYEGA